MDPYVTPEYFKTMGFGLDLDGIDDFELRAILRRASDRVNAITAAPGLPVPYDFRGGSIVHEEHHWHMGNGVNEEMQRTVYPWHTPLLAVSALRIALTNNQGVSFSPSELMVFDSEIEIVSLAMTSMGLFGAYVVPEVGLAEPRIIADYTYGYRIPAIKQTLEATDGKTFRGQDQWWADDEDVIVYDAAGGVVSDADYTVDYDEGAIVFDTNRSPDTIFKASFVTKLPRGISSATGILAAESIGNREMRARGMSGLRSIRVGEIEIEKDSQLRGGTTTLMTPAVVEAEAILAPFKFMWAGA